MTEARSAVADVADLKDDGWGVLEPGSPEAVAAVERRLSERAHDGARLLDDVEAFLARFVVYPGEHERIAHVLWIAHTWLMDEWESTPRIAFLSPEPGSGKSRALEVTEPLVPRPVHAVNATPAYLFRKVSDPDGPPTILFDEIDTIFGPKAKDNEELRGLLNAGHRKGAMAGRCVIKGKEILTEELPAYAAVALAGLDDLPDTIMTRSVVVRMRRRAPGESVEPWRLRTCGPEAEALGDRFAEWSREVGHRIAWPSMPEAVQDRDADVWEALLACADVAGGEWPRRARIAAVALVSRSKERALTIGVLLLRDLRAIFTDAAAEKLPTEDLLDRLVELDESPWGDIRGKALDARGLSRRLAKYGVGPKNVRTPSGIVKGYDAGDLADAWSRYLPPLPSGAESATSATAATNADPGSAVADVADESPRARATCAACQEPMRDLGDGSTTHPGCEVAS